MMIHMWVYEGHLDDSGKVLALDCEGEDFEQPGRMARYQDIITVKSTDHRLLTARMQTADGSWKQIMQAAYRRRYIQLEARSSQGKIDCAGRKGHKRQRG